MSEEKKKSFLKLRNFIESLNHKPSRGWLAIASLVSFGLMGAANTLLEASYAKSKFPVPFFAGQTTFDGELLKSYFKTMIDQGTLDIFVQTQFIDFLFIITVILFGFSLWTLVARLHQPDSFFRKAGLWFALSLPLAGISDAIENLISFILLASPLDFPNWLAIPYSAVAVIKFGFWTIGLLWLPISLVALIISFVVAKIKG
ncbi:MAG: hypothetical protein HN390_02290 [Anaerolineae bacterium]|jgi:hypothetical protein|nr:hypothetical protein [Anaerolineae bacterium]MBT7189002.1 hypothetical protein [Anaerolineae bacterium]MBT7990275.1 hypothetical protein [Anaerolineae bacterium]